MQTPEPPRVQAQLPIPPAAGSSSPAARPRVVVLDDETNMGKVLTKVLAMEGFDAKAFDAPEPALDHIRATDPEVLLSDLRMPGMSGEEVLEAIRAAGLTTEVILMTAYGTVESAMRCVRQGAFDYVTKPFDTKALVAAVRSAAKKRAAPATSSQPAPAVTPGKGELIGDSTAMGAVRDLIRKIAPTDAAVIIYGESGTGKELAARALHAQSMRRGGRFLAINCASIPETLMESELFGYEKGAFTGATEAKAGLLEAASGGTLFLDEIGELPLPLQAKLLRALQEREITRVGSTRNIAVDIRVLAATHRDLEQAVVQNKFRQDLYYRLHVLSVRMPALRQRASDVPQLAAYFLAEFRQRLGKPHLNFSAELIAHLQVQPWRGNVRELRNTVERLAVLSDGPEITRADYEEFVAPAADLPAPTPVRGPAFSASEIEDYREARDRFEADYLRNVLRACAGNVSEAAKRSGMSRRNFYDKLEKLGLDSGEFKE